MNTRKNIRVAVTEPPPLNKAEADAHYRAVAAEHARLQHAATEAREAEQAIEQRIATAARRLDRAKDQLRDDAANAFIAGAEFDQKKLGEKIRSAELERIAAEGQLPLARKRREEAERALADHQYRFDNATGGAAAARESELLAQVRERLAELATPLAELAGVAKWRAGLIGERFSYDPQSFTPVCGRSLAKAMLEAMPPRVTPPGLTIPAIDARAAEVAARISAEMEVWDVI